MSSISHNDCCIRSCSEHTRTECTLRNNNTQHKNNTTTTLHSHFGSSIINHGLNCLTKVASRLATSWYKHTCVPTPVVLVSLSENKMVTVFSCVGSSRVGDPPWMENSGWMIAAIVPPFDATLCSGFAPRGQGPPGCFAATMSLIGPSGDTAATLVLMGGLARCGPSPFFQSLWMRRSAAMLAAVVDGRLGFSVKVDDGKMELAAVVGELSFVSEMQQLALCDEVKESSSCSPISSCNKGTKSFLKNVEISGWKDMFPRFEQSGCSFF